MNHAYPPLRRLLRTASFRLAALYLVLFTGSAAVLGAAVFLTTRSALEQQLRARVEAEAAFLSDTYRDGGLPRLLAEVGARGRGSGALDYRVQDADGKRLGGEIAAVSPGPGWRRVDVGEPDERGADEDRQESLQALSVPLGGGLLLVVGDDTSRVTEAQEAIFRAFAFAVGLAVILGAAGGAWLSHAFLRRVDVIGRTAEAIIAGDLGRRIPVRGTGDDLDRLATTLNRMLDRIAALMNSLRQVSNDIAHDLRTPLSRLGQRLEDARANACSVADFQRAVEGAAADAEGLLGTFAALLRIAEVEAGAQRAAFRVVDLSALAATVAEAFAPSAEDEGRTLSGMVAPGVSVHGDKELLTQMLVNLVENALRHTPRNSRVTVALAANGGEVGGPLLSVEDNGYGVPAAERGRVLRRFYRLEGSRTTPGSGLGLSLAAAVAELHGARLHLQDAGPGLRVDIAFPASDSPR